MSCHIYVDSAAARAYVTDMTHEIDAIGLLCPLPVLKLRKRLQPLQAGEQIKLIADDPAAIVDVPHFCSESGHRLISTSEHEGVLTFVVKKKP